MGNETLDVVKKYITKRLTMLYEHRKNETKSIETATLPADSLYIAEHANAFARNEAQIGELEAVLNVINTYPKTQTKENDRTQYWPMAIAENGDMLFTDSACRSEEKCIAQFRIWEEHYNCRIKEAWIECVRNLGGVEQKTRKDFHKKWVCDENAVE